VNREKAENIIKDYFRAWSTKDMALYSSTLDFGVKVTDNISQMKNGIAQCEESFVEWCDNTNQSKKFIIKDLIYDSRTKKATIFWDVHTAGENADDVDCNIMTIKFFKNKISELNQYSLPHIDDNEAVMETETLV